jgi:hypothetical protein
VDQVADDIERLPKALVYDSDSRLELPVQSSDRFPISARNVDGVADNTSIALDTSNSISHFSLRSHPQSTTARGPRGFGAETRGCL